MNGVLLGDGQCAAQPRVCPVRSDPNRQVPKHQRSPQTFPASPSEHVQDDTSGPLGVGGDVGCTLLMSWEAFSGSSSGKESTCSAGGLGSTPGSERPPGEGMGYPLQYPLASLVAQMIKESTCNVGHLGSSPDLRRSPGEGHGNPLPCSCLTGYGPGACKESDTAERLSTAMSWEVTGCHDCPLRPSRGFFAMKTDCWGLGSQEGAGECRADP